jgi:hypothetical protein
LVGFEPFESALDCIKISILYEKRREGGITYGLQSFGLRFLLYLSQSPSPRAVPNPREPLWRGICKSSWGRGLTERLLYFRGAVEKDVLFYKALRRRGIFK